MPMPAQKPAVSRQDYETPDEFLFSVKKYLYIKDFTIDLAADDGNYVCKPFFTIEDNALIQDWVVATAGGWGWLNPPFGKIVPWVEKAKAEARRGASIAMLVPASVGSNWWAAHVHQSANVVFLRPRISFDGENPFPKDCAMLFYSPTAMPGYHIWDWKSDDRGTPNAQR